MKLKTLALMGAVCTSVVFTSCKKDDDKKETETTPSIVGTWKITAQTITTNFGGMESTQDMYADMEPCQKDDLIKFGEDKTVTTSPGATKCDPSEPASESAGKWELISNNTKLRLIDQGDTSVADVLTLNATTLSIKESESFQGATYSTKLTFTKQ